MYYSSGWLYAFHSTFSKISGMVSEILMSEFKQKRRYDWRVRWQVLKPEKSKEPRHDVVIFDLEVLRRMKELGYLKGQALVDATAMEQFD